VKEMSFKSGVKGRGSDRWWERRWWLWWGDMRRMRWTKRTTLKSNYNFSYYGILVVVVVVKLVCVYAVKYDSIIHSNTRGVQKHSNAIPAT